MADPGFPDGEHQPLDMGQKPIIWQDISRKLHENERIWTEKGARKSSSTPPPPGSANEPLYCMHLNLRMGHSM